MDKQSQWAVPDPRKIKSTDKYALDCAEYYGFTRFFFEMGNYVAGIEGTLKQYEELEKQELDRLKAEENAPTD